jgi:hypothetical protein
VNVVRGENFDTNTLAFLHVGYQLTLVVTSEVMASRNIDLKATKFRFRVHLSQLFKQKAQWIVWPVTTITLAGQQDKNTLGGTEVQLVSARSKASHLQQSSQEVN